MLGFLGIMNGKSDKNAAEPVRNDSVLLLSRVDHKVPEL
jgi:hypothetical protein